MNNKHHHDNREEEVGENRNDNGDLQHQDIVATLQFPIRQTFGQAPMNNISPLVLHHFHGKSIGIHMNSFLSSTFSVEFMTISPVSRSGNYFLLP